jgi:long-chain acyl-CoA synthetase
MSRLNQFLGLLRGYSALECLIEDHTTHSYAALLRALAQWQARFDELGVEPGTVVGLRTDYSIWSIAALIALLERRAVAALIPRDRDCDRYLGDAHSSALLQIVHDGGYQWLPLPQPPTHVLLERLRKANDGGIVVFSSGSTGRPKAALQSAERFLYKFSKPARRFRTLAFLLLDHIAGLDTLFYTLASGGALVLTLRRDPLSILDRIQTHKVEVLPSSPSFLRLLCAAGDQRSHDLSSLKIITYGSEPMDAATLSRLNERFPDVQIIQKYGTTETGSPRSVSRGNDSLWLRIKNDGVETKVVDGVLMIRSESTILGYLNAPSPLDEAGWYRTGDLVEVDGEWIRFRGRTADLINVGGEKVAPAEVEESIRQLDFVREALVRGESHTLLGQMVTAQVALTSNALDAKEAMQRIRAHCRRHLASYKVPIKIEIVAAVQVTQRQKMQRSTPIS